MEEQEKQIEEIAKVMCGGCGSGEECAHGLCATWYNAEKLYNANCRILPEDNIVLLSREEYEKLLRKYFVIKVLPYGDYYTGINKKQREIFDCSDKKLAKRFVSVEKTKSVTDMLDEIGYEYSIEEVDEDLQLSKEAVEKFAKDLLTIWDDLEKWSEEIYEPHSGITPAHIKECIKQFRVDEIKEG